MFTVSDMSKEAPFKFETFKYAFCGETRRVNIASYNTNATDALIKRMQKDPTFNDYTVTVNSVDVCDMCIRIDQATNQSNASYVFDFTYNDARGVIQEIEKLEETNWLMMKHLIDSLSAAGLLNEKGQALKEQRDIWRQQIDTYNDHVNSDIAHEVTMAETNDVTIRPILDVDAFNKPI